MGAVPHPGLHPGAAGRRTPGDPEDGGLLGGLRGGLRCDLRRRQALRAPLAAVAVLGGRRVLPRGAGAAADDLPVLLLRRRLRRHRLVRLRGHRADALQRRGAGRGVPRRDPGGAQGAGGGGVRHRHAQDPGDDAGAAAAGRQDHAAGDHQPDGGGPEGHQPGLRDRGARASPTSASRSTRSSGTRCRRSSSSRRSTSSPTWHSRRWPPGCSGGSSARRRCSRCRWSATSRAPATGRTI